MLNKAITAQFVKKIVRIDIINFRFHKGFILRSNLRSLYKIDQWNSLLKVDYKRYCIDGWWELGASKRYCGVVHSICKRQY